MAKKYRRATPPKVALFLGAGASRAFDYPTTSDFVANLRNVLDLHETRLLDSILKLPKVSDIEDVLRILDPIVNQDSLDYLGTVLENSTISEPILGYKADWETFIQICNTLKQTIITELYSQYEFDRKKLNRIIDCYTELISILNEINGLGILHIFTTNYDGVIENFCINCEKQVEFTCGFRTDNRSGRQF